MSDHKRKDELLAMFNEAFDNMTPEQEKEVSDALALYIRTKTGMASQHAHQVTIHVPQAIEGAKNEKA